MIIQDTGYVSRIEDHTMVALEKGLIHKVADLKLMLENKTGYINVKVERQFILNHEALRPKTTVSGYYNINEFQNRELLADKLKKDLDLNDCLDVEIVTCMSDLLQETYKRYKN